MSLSITNERHPLMLIIVPLLVPKLVLVLIDLSPKCMSFHGPC